MQTHFAATWPVVWEGKAPRGTRKVGAVLPAGRQRIQSIVSRRRIRANVDAFHRSSRG